MTATIIFIGFLSVFVTATIWRVVAEYKINKPFSRYRVTTRFGTKFYVEALSLRDAFILADERVGDVEKEIVKIPKGRILENLE